MLYQENKEELRAYNSLFPPITEQGCQLEKYVYGFIFVYKKGSSVHTITYLGDLCDT